MPRKYRNKFTNFVRINEPPFRELRKFYSNVIEINGVDIRIFETFHDQFFFPQEIEAIRAQNRFAQTAWFMATWTFPMPDEEPQDNQRVRELGIDRFKVLCEIDGDGNPVGNKVLAPNPPFTDDGPISNYE